MDSILLTNTNSRYAGGLFYSVKNLARYLVNNEVNTGILSYNDEASEEDLSSYEDIPMYFYDRSKIPVLKRLAYSRNIFRKLEELHPKIVHQQGIWLYYSYATIKYKKSNIDVKTIITPRGMLDPWLQRNSPIAKRIVRYLYEDENLHSADCLHALCKSEYDSMRALGLKNPIAIIPNGTIIPQYKKTSISTRKKHLVYISRLDPKKGIDILLYALGNIFNSNKVIKQMWDFSIAGWGSEDYINILKNIVKKLNLENVVSFLGPVYGDDKDKLLKFADTFILPSHSEGLPMAILEAWAYGIPVVMTEFCNLPEGFEKNAAFKIDTNIKAMEKGLINFFSLPDESLMRLGQNGRILAEKEFCWDVIARKTIQLYDWLQGKCDKPSFVYE